MSASVSIDDVHLFHKLVVTKIRISLGYARIVQGDERQTSGTVPPRQSLDLGAAKTTLAVINDHVGFRQFLYRWQPLLGVAVHCVLFLPRADWWLDPATLSSKG